MGENEVLERIRRAMEKVSPTTRIELDSVVTELGLDSMAVVDFFLEVEGEFGVRLPQELIEERGLARIEKLVGMMEERQ